VDSIVAMTLRDQVSAVLDQIPIDFGGGCSVSKGTVMADLIARNRIKRSIDIGIYRGRSFFPQAIGHKVSNGKVYGIDPYTNSDAEEHDHLDSDRINDFINSTDFAAMYATVDGMRTQFGVATNSEIVRERSHDAAKKLTGKFGLIHIDGNHDTAPVVQDVDDYLPLLESEGFLVMDDISWPSVKPAVDIVSAQLALIYARVDSMNDYAVFWNGTNARKKARLRVRVAEMGEN
jgi:hypothetical protein